MLQSFNNSPLLLDSVIGDSKILIEDFTAGFNQPGSSINFSSGNTGSSLTLLSDTTAEGIARLSTGAVLNNNYRILSNVATGIKLLSLYNREYAFRFRYSTTAGVANQMQLLLGSLSGTAIAANLNNTGFYLELNTSVGTLDFVLRNNATAPVLYSIANPLSTNTWYRAYISFTKVGTNMLINVNIYSDDLNTTLYSYTTETYLITDPVFNYGISLATGVGAAIRTLATGNSYALDLDWIKTRVF